MGYYTNKKLRAKIDVRLDKIASLNATLGSDSTITEYKRVKKQIHPLELEIKDMDHEFWKSTFWTERQ